MLVSVIRSLVEIGFCHHSRDVPCECIFKEDVAVIALLSFEWGELELMCTSLIKAYMTFCSNFSAAFHDMSLLTIAETEFDDYHSFLDF